MRQLLIEGFALAVLGGAFGLLLGLWSSDLLVASMGNMMPVDIVWEGGLNASILLATFGFCVLGTLCFRPRAGFEAVRAPAWWAI